MEGGGEGLLVLSSNSNSDSHIQRALSFRSNGESSLRVCVTEIAVIYITWSKMQLPVDITSSLLSIFLFLLSMETSTHFSNSLLTSLFEERYVRLCFLAPPPFLLKINRYIHVYQALQGNLQVFFTF